MRMKKQYFIFLLSNANVPANISNASVTMNLLKSHSPSLRKALSFPKDKRMRLRGVHDSIKILYTFGKHSFVFKKNSLKNPINAIINATKPYKCHWLTKPCKPFSMSDTPPPDCSLSCACRKSSTYNSRKNNGCIV